MNRVSVANLALSNLGEAPIQNLNDNNARARIANARIDDVIRTVLRGHDWNSAMKRVSLTKITDPLFGWNSTFQLPIDYLKVIQVWPVSKFRVQGPNILSNEATLNLLYIYEPSDINSLDVLLAESIALKLAVEMAETLTGKDGLKDRMMQKYLMALQEARSANSKDKTPEHREESTFWNARRRETGQPHRTFSSPAIGYAVENNFVPPTS
jgi:hypothetical protein|tara:strand:+ start:92 stop:724 length:633 start_codon:yes stop_codon:yes gene_type:complete